MAQPIADVVLIGSIPPPTRCRLVEPAFATLDLDGEKTPEHFTFFDHFDLRIDAVVLSRLFTEQPTKVLLDCELRTSHPFPGNRSRVGSAHEDILPLRGPPSASGETGTPDS
jgi:hypothetical protein